MNVPWYNVLYQPDYVEMFGYIGPHVKYRNLLIKDEDNNIFNNHFQSDFVDVILSATRTFNGVMKEVFNNIENMNDYMAEL